MSESDSVHKTVVGWKVFNFRSDLKKCTKRGLPKGLAERVEEFDENFKLMFHLRRSDLEDWISKTSSTEMFVCEVESART